MRQHYLAAGFLLATATAAYSQTSGAVTAPNAIYLELLGNGGLYSLNFDRRLSPRTSLRIGFAHWSSSGGVFDDSEREITTMPVMLNRLRGSGNHKLELGAGILVGRSTRTESSFAESADTKSFFTFTGLIGYRYQRADGGPVFRAGFTPFFGLGDDPSAYPEKGLLPSAGASFGYAF